MAAISSGPIGNARYPGGGTAEPFGRLHAEQVMDMVFDRSADKTAFISSIRDGDPVWGGFKTFDHVCDKLEPITDPVTMARAEGGTSNAASDWSRAVSATHGEGRGITFTKRVRFQNFVENFREDVEVHNINDYLKAFGVAREYSYQVAKKSKRLAIGMSKRVWEDVYLPTTSAEGAVEHVGTGIADPTLMRPLIEQLFVHCEATQSATSGGFNYLGNVFRAEDVTRITNGQVALGSGATGKASANLPTLQVRLNEDIVTLFAQAMSGNEDDADAMFDMLWTSSAPWGHMGGLGSVQSPSGNLGALTLMQDAMIEKIKRAVRIIESQFGPAAVGRDRWIKQPANTGSATTFTRATSPIAGRTAAAPGYLWGIQMDMVERRWMRPFFHDPLPPQGDSTIGMVLGDGGVDLLHPQAAGVVAAINNN